MTLPASPEQWANDASRYIEKCMPYFSAHMPGQFAGLSVAVYQHGKPVFAHGYGFADKEDGTEMTPEHMFHAASHTKTVTAIATMQLAEQGKLALDDKASDYIPEMKENPDEHIQNITIRDLLAHKAKLQRDAGVGFWSLLEPFPSKEELLEIARTEPHTELPNDTNPEEHYKYSNYGYALLGQVIEKASGKSYEEYVTEEIFKPLGLTDKDITVDYKPQNQSRQVTAYSIPDADGTQQPFKEEAITTNGFAPATGLCATPGALARIFSALLPDDDTLLSRESKEHMVQPDALHPNHFKTYGLGLTKYEDPSRYGHGGMSPLEISYTTVNPENGIVVCVAENAASSQGWAINQSLHNTCEFFRKHPPSEALKEYDDHIFQTHSGRFLTAARKTEDGKDVVYLGTPNTLEPFTHSAVCELIPQEGKPGLFNILSKKSDINIREEETRFTKDGDGTITMLDIGGTKLFTPKVHEAIRARQNIRKAPTGEELETAGWAK